MGSIKSKRILIIFLDIALGILIGLFTSKTFPRLVTLIVIIFVILLIIRVGVDWFAITDEERYYKEFVKIKLDEMQRDESVQRIIHDKIEEALKSGNMKEYREYSKIKKDLK